MIAAQPQQDATLTEQEAAKRDALASGIDVRDTAQVLAFGSEAQQKIASFSDEVLQGIRTRDTGEVSDMLTQLVAELKGFDTKGEKQGFFARLFQSSANQIVSMKARYDKVETNVSVIVDALQRHKGQLMDDIGTLDHLYALNQQYFRELNVFIAAGEERTQTLREQDLPVLLQKAQESGDAVDAQAARDFADQVERLEKKVHDLRLTRTVSIQMAPQVRLMQNNDNVLAEKIQSTLANTIPLWKSQMVIALGLAHADRALQAQQAVADMTNELLRKNAEALHQGTVQTAKAAERGVVDIETIRITNQALIQTLDEVKQVQIEGAAARAAAQAELVRLEEELKQKLLAFRANPAPVAAQPAEGTVQ
jgi:uncharacterized protein YaaN involved in tellurite resistance